MCHRYIRRSQSGLGLPSALFVILVLTLIISAMQNLNQLSAEAYGREWLALRAFYAAESGAQLAATYAINPDESAPTCNATFISALSFSDIGLNDCEVTVACEAQTVDGEQYWTMTSTGQCGTGGDQASRVIQVRLRL